MLILISLMISTALTHSQNWGTVPRMKERSLARKAHSAKEAHIALRKMNESDLLVFAVGLLNAMDGEHYEEGECPAVDFFFGAFCAALSSEEGPCEDCDFETGSVACSLVCGDDA